MRDFTLDMYAGLCATALAAGYVPMTVRQYLRDASRPARVMIMRHDIDRWPRRALAMAEIEARHGVLATYYVRMTRHVFRPPVIRRLAELGHEIGYHYETLARARGDVPRALAAMREELTALRALATVDTAAMHGSPLSRIDNRAIWRHATLTDFGLRGEAYLSLDYGQLGYYTDTGRSWSADTTNLRDRPPGVSLAVLPAASSEDLRAVIASGQYPALCIQTHPERWSGSLGGWCVSALMDGAVNVAKRVLRSARRSGVPA